MEKQEILEDEYRASRICRVLGNPSAYHILKILSLESKRPPSEIADKLSSSVSNISKTLRCLRQIDLVRYDTKWKEKSYYLKDRKVAEMLQNLEELVRLIREKK